MEPTRHNPQHSNPGQPGQRPISRPRPLMSDFAPRRTSPTGVPVRRPQPLALTPAAPTHHVQSPQPILKPVAQPQHHVTPQPVQHRPVQHQPAIQRAPVPPQHRAPTANPSQQTDPSALPATHAKHAKKYSRSSHAGFVGFVVFVVLTALFMLPVIPGKIFNSFPGSSQSFSSGDQIIACVDNPTNLKTSVKYNSKNGFPIVYNYATTSTLTGNCDGHAQSATGGHTSQFNPLGAVIDVALALVLAIIVGKVWARIRDSRRA